MSTYHQPPAPTSPIFKEAAGVTPAQLIIAPAPLTREVPVAPVSIASTLLERRPDIAAA